MSEQDSPSSPWTVQATLLRISNPWLTLIGERLQTPDHQQLDYWRLERADSAIVLPLWRGQMLLPPPVYRPGVAAATLDFPGGRVGADQTPMAAARQILQRELGVEAVAIANLTPLNTEGWPINSSLSNQRLFGFLAQLQDDRDMAFAPAVRQVPWTSAGIQELRQELTCLQCRAVLMEAVYQP